MKKITSRKKLLLYGCSGLGINMLNLIVGSYLCSALLVGGFDDNVESWTYLNKDLVVAGLWSIMVLATKIIDGVIDLPFASFTDRLKTRWGRRRPSILIGYIPTLISYLLFLIPLTSGESYANTVWFGILLGVFYCFYTLTMLTYYATFAEVTEKEEDMVFLSNVKSVCDVIYFIFGYALLPVFISLGINIRYVALIFLPLALTMLIPFFLLKEKPTNVELSSEEESSRPKSLTLGGSIKCAFRNRDFIFWLFTAMIMNFGLQLFLGGINELFSSTGLNMTIVMASSFAPVPFTILLYNKIVNKFGLGIGYRYILSVFSVGMIIMFICTVVPMSELVLTLVAVLGGILVSFSIGAFFSVTYTIPSHLAQQEFERTGTGISSMYFAVQGLFEGIAAGLATGPMLVLLKDTRSIHLLPLVVVASCAVAFLLSFKFPGTLSKMGVTKSRCDNAEKDEK